MTSHGVLCSLCILFPDSIENFDMLIHRFFKPPGLGQRQHPRSIQMTGYALNSCRQPLDPGGGHNDLVKGDVGFDEFLFV